MADETPVPGPVPEPLAEGLPGPAFRRHRDGYRVEAYHFLHRALRFAQVQLQREGHVTGTELLEGFRVLVIQEFGPMARIVLDHWGIHSTDDVGLMVKSLVDAGEWGRRDQDLWDEFHGAYDFEHVFEREYPWNVREALNLPAEAHDERSG